MTNEGLEFDRKSICYELNKHHDAGSLACDCVAFANVVGGTILICKRRRRGKPKCVLNYLWNAGII